MHGADDDQAVAVMIELEVEPRHQRALAVGLADNVERYMKGFAGFVSATFLESSDGRRVVNYAVWRSEGELEAFRGATDAGQVEREDLFERCGARPVAVRTFRVARFVSVR